MPEGAESLRDWTARALPERKPIVGRFARLEPLSVAAHADELFEAAQGEGSDPALWDYLGVGPFPDFDSFAAWVATVAGDDATRFLAVVDVASGKAQGVVSYMRMDPANGVIEIGNIWFGRVMQQSRNATETIYLLARHVFDDLGYRRLEWKCNNRNERSKAAAERFGFSFEGIFRQHMIIKGENRDTAWFGMTDGDWPRVRAGFEAWLDDANFDEQGRQKRSLRDLRVATTG